MDESNKSGYSSKEKNKFGVLNRPLTGQEILNRLDAYKAPNHSGAIDIAESAVEYISSTIFSAGKTRRADSLTDELDNVLTLLRSLPARLQKLNSQILGE